MKKFIKPIIALIVLAIIIYAVISLFSGDDKKNQSLNTEILPVKTNNSKQTIHFTGTIDPIKINNVTSPVNGVIESRDFEYGQFVRKGQELFTIHSEELEQEYQEALKSYLTAKKDATLSDLEYNSSKLMHKDGLISDNDFIGKKSNKFSSQLGLIVAESKLDQLFAKFPDHEIDFKELDLIENFDEVTEELNRKFHTFVIISPMEGIALKPKETSDSDGKLEVGDDTTKGGGLLSIGDLDGVSIDFSINEVDFKEIRIGQKAKITGPAFPGITLEGEITNLSAQADEGNSGVPTFSVIAKVKQLTEEQKKHIRVGMSTQISITVELDTNITLPHSAIKRDKDNYSVTVVDANGEHPQQRSVVIGKSTETSIIITYGLKPGEYVLVRHNA